jgi:hypothetical protein
MYNERLQIITSGYAGPIKPFCKYPPPMTQIRLSDGMNGPFRPLYIACPFSLRKGKALDFATPHNLKLDDKSEDTLGSATRTEYQGASCVELSSTGNEIDVFIEMIPIHYLHNTTCGKSKMNDYRMK